MSFFNADPIYRAIILEEFARKLKYMKLDEFDPPLMHLQPLRDEVAERIAQSYQEAKQKHDDERHGVSDSVASTSRPVVSEG